MKKFLISILALILLISSAEAQNANLATKETIEETPAKSIIRGRVVYEDSGKPVRRGLIGLLDIKETFKKVENFNGYSSSDIYLNYFVLTNDDGEFEIKNVKAGDYYPFVQVPNVLNPQSINKFYDRNNTISLTKLEEFFQKITADGFSEIQVLISVKRGAMVSGKVLYSDGSPVINAKVEIVRKGSKEFNEEIISVREMLSDDRGFYRFTELLPGEYYIKITEPSDHKGNNITDDSGDFLRASELTTFYSNASDIKRAKFIEVNWGQEQTNVDITIPDRKLFKISGVIVTKNNQQPIKNAALKFQKIDEAKGAKYYSNHTNTIYSDEKGKWLFKDLPQGIYRIETSPPDGGKSEKTDLPKYAQSFKEVRIEADNLEDILIELPLESSVSGTVIVEGKKEMPSFIDIYLFDIKRKVRANASYYDNQGDDQSKPKKTQRDFRLGELSEGKYLFSVYNRGDFYVKSIKLGNTDLTVESLEIREGQEIKDIQIIFANDVGTLEGKVFESRNIPAKITLVGLVPTDLIKQKGNNLYFSALTNAYGEFQIKAAPGEYFITFPKAEDRELSEEDWIKKVTKEAKRVTIKAKETIEISLNLSSN